MSNNKNMKKIKIYTLWAEQTKLDLEMYEKLTDTAKEVYNVLEKCSEKIKSEQYAPDNKQHNLKSPKNFDIEQLAMISNLSSDMFIEGFEELLNSEYFMFYNQESDTYTFCNSRLVF